MSDQTPIGPGAHDDAGAWLLHQDKPRSPCWTRVRR